MDEGYDFLNRDWDKRYLAVDPYVDEFPELAHERAYNQDFETAHALLSSDRSGSLEDDMQGAKAHFDIVENLDSVIEDEDFYKDITFGVDSILIEGKDTDAVYDLHRRIDLCGYDVDIVVNELDEFPENVTLVERRDPLETGKTFLSDFREFFQSHVPGYETGRRDQG